VLVAAAVVGTFLFVVRKPTAAPTGKTIAQYEYQFVIPEDWTQTGGKVEDRKVVVHPTDAQTGDDLIAVQEFRMDYDATADRNRLVEGLRTEAQAGPQYSGFTADLQFAGKTLIYYRQLQANSTVDWYVAVQGKVRVHVGCQYAAPASQQRVQAACQQIIQTLQVHG
jgi:type VII secretion-associated protein (TIGR03931 family)